MARRPALVQAQDETVRTLDRGFWLVAALAVVLVFGMVARIATDNGDGTGSAGPSTAAGVALGGATADAPQPSVPSGGIDLAAYMLATPREAPPLELTSQDDRRVSLASFRGEPVFVFFGYTHCPDVCPATIGAVGLAMDAFGPGVRGMFVSVDPARDTTTWLREYVRFLPEGFTALTGTEGAIRDVAHDWGVQYARVETGDPGAYSMAHTADVYLIDSAGMHRATFPFGTGPEAMTAVLREVVATPLAGAPTPAPSVRPTAAASAPAATLPMAIEVVSSSVWAGPPSPVILGLSVAGSPLRDTTVSPVVQLSGLGGELRGDPVRATPVRPVGVETVSYVADLAIPSPGPWRIRVTLDRAGRSFAGTTSLTALDPGGTAAIGQPAPRIATPTLDDVGGVVRAVTTDPAPDLRLSRRSTVDALADGKPFVLVIDSTKFRVSPACGRAVIMARFLLDRWRDVEFIHLEPYRYSVVASTPVLDGSLEDPTLTDPAAAWGFGEPPWGAKSMPWVFVVDGSGIVRASYQGVMGTADVDVMLSLLAGER